MMPRIKKLRPEEAQKIAAGEVVERPANVVKELLENALDAGATSIQIYIEDGGKKLVRIVDNGHAMNKEDAHLCFAHHATSKLEQITDLPDINTFGFRGEALSSIASVSQVELITRTAEQETAYKLTLDSGTVTACTEVAHAVGTDISIRNLFFNIPARQKFLKKRETEWRQINTLVHACAVSNLDKEFSLYSEHKRILFCPAAATLADRIDQLKTAAFGARPLALEQHIPQGGTIHGCISHHQHGRYDRSQIFFFVNKRWVKNTHLSRALIKGYDNVLPSGRFPAAIISIDIDPHEVDVNTHPRKEEVQFLHPRRVEAALTSAVRSHLEQELSKKIKKQPSVFIEKTPQKPFTYQPQPIVQPRPFGYSITPQPVVPKNPEPSIKPDAKQTEPQKHIETPNTIADLDTSYRLIGQLKKTYLLIEHADGLFVVDQHAAHERILYEQLCKQFKDAAVVHLLFPQHITLSAEDMHIIEPHLPLLQENGIQIEPFSQNELIIQATPVYLKKVNLTSLVKQCIGWIQEYSKLSSDDFIKEIHFNMRAQMACKGAVKAGDELNTTQMQQLLDDLHTVEHRFTCPHGRPTGWLLHQYDIEKKFKRIAS